jgi:hypothetical protein
MARRRRSYSRKNQLVDDVTTTDLVVGGLILASIVGIVGFVCASSQSTALASTSTTPTAASNPSGLNPGFSWQSQGTTAAPTVGSLITAVAQDAGGNSYPVTGRVTASSASGVTFKPVQTRTAQVTTTSAASSPATAVPNASVRVQALPNPALASEVALIQVPLAYVTGCFGAGLPSNFCWVATGNISAPSVGDSVMTWAVRTDGAQGSFQGTVTAVDKTHVTFRRSTNPSLRLPLGYLYNITKGGGEVLQPLSSAA